MFALARTQSNGTCLYLARDEEGGELVPDLRKDAAHLMNGDEAERLAAKVNKYTAEPYEVVGVRNEVE